MKNGAMETGMQALLSAVVLATLIGCSSEQVSSPHLDLATPQAESETDEEEFLRSQQMLLMQQLTPAGVEQGEPFDGDPQLLTIYATNYCFPTLPTLPLCEIELKREVVRHLCTARIFLSAATMQSEPLDIVYAGGGMRIFPIAEEGATKLALQSIQYAQMAMAMASDRLLNPPVHCRNASGSPSTTTPGGLWVPDSEGKTLAGGFASAYLDSYYLARAAYDRAVEATLNSSDKMRGTTVSPRGAIERSISGAELSRAAAAHLLVGGDPGLAGSTTQALCTQPDLTPQARSALQILRDSGISPTMLSGPTTTPALLNGVFAPGSIPNDPNAAGSVRQRLGEFYGLDRLNNGASVDAFYELSLADFDSARAYLNEEIAAFGRSTFARHKIEVESPTGYRRYVATATEPSRLPPVAWAARARFATTDFTWPPPAGVFVAPPSLDRFVASTYATVLNIARKTDSFATLNENATATRESVVGGLSSILLGKEFSGVIETSMGPSGPGTATFFTHGYSVAERLRLVVGEDGLRCAVEGSIEGAACDTATTAYPCATTVEPNLECLTVAKLNAAEPGDQTPYGATVGVFRAIAINWPLLTNSKSRLYVVKPKTATSPEIPGEFEVLTGFVAQTGRNFYPIVPLVDSRVGDVLAPSRKFCSVPEVSCANESIDARLPLEDELTEDSDGVESSWRHYLSLARSAADEADLLGKEFIETKIQQSSEAASAAIRREERLQRAEEALAEVQAMCGTEADSRKILDFLSSPTGTVTCSTTPPIQPCGYLQTCIGGRCVNTAPNLGLIEENKSCPAQQCRIGYVCTAGRCIADIGQLAANAPSDPELKRLAECLDQSPTATVDMVTLADVPLCVATEGSDPRVRCPAGAGLCPRPAETGTMNGQTTYICPPDTADIKWKQAEPLSYFAYEQQADTGVNECDAFRELRKTPGNPSALRRLRASDILHPVRIRDRVGRIGFTASHASYGTVTEDRGPRFSTGSIDRPPVTSWPCVGPAYAGCTMQQTGLFCSFAPSCAATAAIDRARMNYRLFRAAFAAHVIQAEDATKIRENLDRDSLDFLFGDWPFFDDQPEKARWLLPVGSESVSSDNHYPIYEHATSSMASPGNPINISDGNYIVGVRKWRARSSKYESASPPVSWMKPDGTSLVANGGAPLLSVWMEVGTTAPLTIQKHEWFFFGNLSSLAAVNGTQAWTAGVLVNGKSSGLLIPRFVPNTGLLNPLVYPNGVIEPLRGEEILDGIELLCEMSGAKANNFAVRPGTLGTLEDVESAGRYIEKLARDIDRSAAKVIFGRVPRLAFDAIKDASSDGAPPSLSGDMAEHVMHLRDGLRAIQRVIPRSTGAIAMLSAEMRSLRAVIEANEIKLELVDLKTLSTTLDRATECADSVLGIKEIADTIVTAGAKPAVDCANAFAQIAIAFVAQGKEKELISLNTEIEKAGFSGRMAQIAQELQLTAIDLQDGIDQVRTAIAVIESFKRQARVSLARAAYFASAQSDEQVRFIKTLGSLARATQVRYQRALKNARRMSFLAKRAIELRLGVRLSEMRERLPFVETPAGWEGSVCTLSGLDALAFETLLAGQNFGRYTDAFIGDYVTKLENLVESYRLRYKFHEGDDMAVVSLRDDVTRTRAACSVPGQNLLLQAGQLDDATKWRPVGCNPVTIGPTTYLARNCVTAIPNGETPITTPDTSLSGAVGYRLQLGDGRGCPASPGVVGPCGWKAGAALSQAVSLLPGRYRLSWYTKEASGSGGARIASLRLLPTGALPSPTIETASFQVLPGAASNDWNRVVVRFTATREGSYEIGFGVTDTGATSTTPPSYALTLAAPMLEVIPLENGVVTQLPSFQNTADDGTVTLNACEDTDGSVFRLKHWRRDCVRLCNGGFTNNCSDGTLHCYRELSFGVSQGWLQSGRLFNYSGFARGNFNYRIESLALNFVGSGARTCEDADLPNTCFNAGFVPYSIEHNGPFFVRNHEGDDFRAFLFDGRIEHARGLAAERYLTNPLSTTDRELLQDYFRSELQGRPLDGNFVVRVWEEPGVNFDGIEDVQLLLKYRYWTRFD